MDDMGIGMFLFPQMYDDLSNNGKQDRKLIAICPKCGSENDHPYKYCKECGEPSIFAKRFRTCKNCGESFDLEKPPICCPYCTERF